MRSFFLSIFFILLLSLTLLTGSANTGQGDQIQIGSSGLQDKPAQEPIQDPKKKPAQEPVQDQDEPPLRLSSRLILVPVSASNSSGNPVKDLKVEDIVIEEEGRPQKVVTLGEPGKTAVEIALLLDVSGSTNDQFAFQQLASVQFIKEVLKPSDAVSVFSIGLTPKMVMGRTTNSAEAIKGLMTIVPLKEPTAFFDSIVEAAHYLNKNADSSSRRVLIVISDGEENFSKSHKLNDALRELQKNDCLFYAINPSGDSIRLNTISLKGHGFMESMASQTGGKAFNLRRVEELETIFHQIAEELQSQYLFGYYSSDERNEVGFKRITVRAPSRPELRIRTRQGYYVSKN